MKEDKKNHHKSEVVRTKSILVDKVHEGDANQGKKVVDSED